MITVHDIANAMEKYAPAVLAEEWDNVGLLVGNYDATVNTVLVGLDCDSKTIAEAIETHADIIITHHPIMLTPIRSITNATLTGRLILRLIASKISLFAAHTNLDSAPGGVNDVLAARLGLFNVKDLRTSGFEGSARIGEISSQTLAEFEMIVQDRLGSTVLKRVGNKNKIVKTVGVCGGSGGQMIEGAHKSGCDLLIVGEAKYSDEQKASELGLALLEAGHFETERLICSVIAEKLSKDFAGLNIIISGRNTTYYE